MVKDPVNSLAWGRNEHGEAPPINPKRWGERYPATDVVGVKEGNKTFCQRHVEPSMDPSVARTIIGQLPYNTAVCLLFAGVAPAAGSTIAPSRALPTARTNPQRPQGAAHSFKMQERTLSRKSPRGHAKRTPSRRAFCAIVESDDKSSAMSLSCKADNFNPIPSKWQYATTDSIKQSLEH